MPNFQETKYETDFGNIFRIRVSDQTLAAAGQTVPTAGLTDDKVWVFASNPGSKRKKALNARGVVLGRDVGIAPNVFTRRTFLPILQRQVWLDTEINDPITISGIAYTVKDKVDEA